MWIFRHEKAFTAKDMNDAADTPCSYTASICKHSGPANSQSQEKKANLSVEEGRGRRSRKTSENRSRNNSESNRKRTTSTGSDQLTELERVKNSLGRAKTDSEAGCVDSAIYGSRYSHREQVLDY